MARKLTDQQYAQILARRAEGASYRQIAEEFGVSPSAIVKIAKTRPVLAEHAAKKQRENVKDIFEYMDLRKDRAINVLDLAFEALQNPEKYQRASVQSIATMIGIILDKYTQLAQLSKSGGISNELLESLLALERESKRNGD